MESWGQGDVMHQRTAWIHRLTAVVIAGFMLTVLGCSALARACGIKRIMDGGAVVGTGSAVALDTDSDGCRSVTWLQSTLHSWDMRPLSTIYHVRSVTFF